MTKREQAIAYLKKGNLTGALRIAKGFKMNVTKQERFLMSTGYEYLVHPDFYRQLGANLEVGIAAAERTLHKILNIQEESKNDRRTL